MQGKKQQAIIVKDFKKPLVYEDTSIPEPKPGQVLVKMIASTINPSDRIMIQGKYRKTEPNFIPGLQGVGQVVKAGCQMGEKLIGKKVTLAGGNGTWAEYTTVDIERVWQVDIDVPLESAASGVINPITAIGFVDTFRKWKNGKGIINSAAASSLGKMLIKYCQRENIPLMNIVRRKQQVQILQEQGAKFIINTSDQNWVEQYKQVIQVQGFNVLFDAIGGGQVSDKLISNLASGGHAFIYGKLSSDPLTISKPMIFTGGMAVSGWLVFDWFLTLSKQEREKIQKNYSNLLKNQLSTKSIKKIKLSEVPQNLNEAEKRSSEGKFTILIQYK